MAKENQLTDKLAQQSTKDIAPEQQTKLTAQEIKVIETPLHPQAEKLIEDLTLEFASSLQFQAKLLAHRRKDEIVLSNHVDEALEITRQERKQKGWQKWAVVLGSALLGFALRGFFGELSGGRNPIYLGVYFVVFGISLLLLFLGLNNRI
jgi:hypothetical protein